MIVLAFPNHVVVAPAEKWRIEVDQIYRLIWHLAHDLQIVAAVNDVGLYVVHDVRLLLGIVSK